MKSVDKGTLALKLAEALLLYKGKLSIKDIEAIPFLDNPTYAELIVNYLRAKFKTQISAKRIQEKEGGGWEESITLLE